MPLFDLILMTVDTLAATYFAGPDAYFQEMVIRDGNDRAEVDTVL